MQTDTHKNIATYRLIEANPPLDEASPLANKAHLFGPYFFFFTALTPRLIQFISCNVRLSVTYSRLEILLPVGLKNFGQRAYLKFWHTSRHFWGFEILIFF